MKELFSEIGVFSWRKGRIWHYTR